MASSIPANPTVQTISQLLVKLTDNDPDFRFMALNDLLQVLAIMKPELLHHDYNVSARTIDHLVRTLDDQNGEVQNLAIKCLGPLVEKLPSHILGPLMEKLASLKVQNSVDNTVPSLALKAVIEALPRPALGLPPSKDVSEAYAGISRVLIPRLLGRSIPATKSAASKKVRLPPPSEGLLEGDLDVTSESLDVLIEVVKCFGPMLQPVEVEALQDAVVSLLERDRGSSVAKKRAVVAVSILAVYLSDDMLNAFVSRSVSVFNDPRTTVVTRRLYINIIGSMTRSIPNRFGQHVERVLPFILTPLGEEDLQRQLEEVGDGNDSDDFNDLREAALVALEAFLASCPNQMRPYTEETLAACLRYLKYDPNYAVDDDDEEMDEDEDDVDELEEDDEFEANGAFDDDDDASWKVRRCAAKAIYTLISTRSSGDLLDSGFLYREAAPALIKRFDEREENVRLEVISAMSLLIRKTGEGIIPEFSLDDTHSEYLNQLPLSRKRRRQSSGGAPALTSPTSGQPGGPLASPTREKIPTSGPRADLAAQTQSIVKAVTKMLQGKLIPTKQAAINLLDDIVAVQQGGLSEYFDQVIGPINEAIKPLATFSASSNISVAAGTTSATPGTLRVAALRLMSHITKTHSSQILQPYLSDIVDRLLTAVHDRFYKISGEAIETAEEIIKAITPPRSRLSASKYKPELQKLYDVLVSRMEVTDVDAEVRQKAIHALGTLLSRTSTPDGQALLAASKRQAALISLLERLRNETTRLAAVRAIDDVAASLAPTIHIGEAWVQQVAVELAGQLRKANRALRSSSIQALRHLVHSPAMKKGLDSETIRILVGTLEPVITNNDPHLLGPALRILADLVSEQPGLVVTPQLISALCELLQSTVAASVLDSLLQLVTIIGQKGVGQPLMAGLLKDVGIDGDPAVVGKVIGNLLVASGSSAGVTIESFISEVQNSRGDETRASLALAVLGESGLRLGPQSPIKPTLFLSQFTSDYDKVSVSAAVALGRAGAGNVPEYLPVILERMTNEPGLQYLLLQSIREVLQQVALSPADIGAFSSSVWDKLLATARQEDNKAVCAECLGRLAIIAPQTYIPNLQTLLQSDDLPLRAIAIQAIRYTLPDSGDVFDGILKQHLVDMLNVMLEDPEMEIRRLALTVLNSAAHNKPDLIHSHLGQLMPYVMAESKLKPELIREVQMGPFKHLVDDGLEVRKAAYETLYALMETAFSRISTLDLYDRIIDGLGDDNDIRALCNLMVSKLAFISPEETTRRLDAIADKYRATLTTKLKENAVKQELEKQDEANKSVLRVTLLLGDKLKGSLSSTGVAMDLAANQNWSRYWDWVNKEFYLQLKVLRDESKELGGGSY